MLLFKCCFVTMRSCHIGVIERKFCRSVFLQFGNFGDDLDFETCVDIEGLESLYECEDLFDEVT